MGKSTFPSCWHLLTFSTCCEAASNTLPFPPRPTHPARNFYVRLDTLQPATCSRHEACQHHHQFVSAAHLVYRSSCQQCCIDTHITLPQPSMGQTRESTHQPCL